VSALGIQEICYETHLPKVFFSRVIPDTMTILKMTLLIITLLVSVHNIASSPDIQLVSFYLLMQVKSFLSQVIKSSHL
jgi:hypothetical protein